jgi:type II secretory pathway component PulK
VRRRSRQGVALVLVLWLVVVLGVIGAGIVAGARTSTAMAANVRARVVARYAAESGIEALVAFVEDSLERATGVAARRDFLNGLQTAYGAGDSVVLGNGRFAPAVVDVSARLDINAATESALRAFFSRFTDLAGAATIAHDVRGRIEAGAIDGRPEEVFLQRDPRGDFRPVRPIRSLEELREWHLVPDRVLASAAPYLTVDGDGVINRRTASDTVLAAASGEVHDEPSRLLFISRGWQGGHPLTHEIQAVYALSGNRLVLVHWRERDL